MVEKNSKKAKQACSFIEDFRVLSLAFRKNEWIKFIPNNRFYGIQQGTKVSSYYGICLLSSEFRE